MRLLARREHSNLELTRKLDKRGFDLAEIGRVLRALSDEGLLSDRRYAEAFARAAYRGGWGRFGFVVSWPNAALETPKLRWRYPGVTRTGWRRPNGCAASGLGARCQLNYVNGLAKPGFWPIAVLPRTKLVGC